MLNQFNNLKNKASNFIENTLQKAKTTATSTLKTVENFTDNKLNPSQCNPQDVVETVATMKEQFSNKNKPN